MADITVRLICYKLGEGYKKAGDRLERFFEWLEDFSWRRLDLLDMLFLGWLLAAFLVVGAINLYLRFFGLPRARKSVAGGTVEWTAGGHAAGATPVSLAGAESCQWLNVILRWFHLQHNKSPTFVETCLKVLNEQAHRRTVSTYSS